VPDGRRARFSTRTTIVIRPEQNAVVRSPPRSVELPRITSGPTERRHRAGQRVGRRDDINGLIARKNHRVTRYVLGTAGTVWSDKANINYVLGNSRGGDMVAKMAETHTWFGASSRHTRRNKPGRVRSVYRAPVSESVVDNTVVFTETELFFRPYRP